MCLITPRAVRRCFKSRYHCKRDLFIVCFMILIVILSLSVDLEQLYSFIQNHQSSLSLLLFSSFNTPIANRLLILVRTSHHCESRLKYLLKTWIPPLKRNQQKSNIFLLTDQYIKNSSYDKFENVILTDCPQKHKIFDLCCKTADEFQLYHNLTKNGAKFDWMCRFDDDQYVNLDNLYSYLTKLNSSIPYYIGRTSKYSIKIPDNNQTVHFATYGAGVCYSKVLLSKLQNYINKSITPDDCIKTRFADDAYLGYTIAYKLNTSLTINKQLHSHLERLQISFHRLTLENLLEAITFGFSWDRYQLKWMPVIHEIIQLSRKHQKDQDSLMLLWNFVRDYEKTHPENITGKVDDSCTSYHKEKNVSVANMPNKAILLTTKHIKI
ncbi:unnamed protein product [Didymodactylos carnosus]|uniref:Fringe-like glycosyltransferase domain-containing protein n=1 Tax=Didymodactylos carnosus TaxID=1234261 RepID=A0A814EC27_9BILA|nr:unnamed protein product [Didymodactylos carnosus]CAF1510428.1 unnamed protein product [Didymodactylos carnosus]CAF3740304.1 unnamed protein product [Didymodactylos carnosus]CAF4298410.1 unnamed protein product [Didymodactylos carnosus]